MKVPIKNYSKENQSFQNGTNGYNFKIREQLFKYLGKWYIFALGILFFGILAHFYIRYTVPLYNVSATILISQDDKLKQSELAAFQDLKLLDGGNSKVENEILILKSRTLIANVVKKLKLNVRYFSEGRILELENYPKSIIQINFLSSDSIVDTKSQEFITQIQSQTSFSFLDAEGKIVSTHDFGKTVHSNIGDVVITPLIDDIHSYKNKVVTIRVSPVKRVAENYRNGIQIFLAGKNSSIVNISINDPVKEKAKDILNTLIEEYNRSTIENKKITSAKTAEFINDRLDLISGDLLEVDEEAAGYRSKFGLTNDISAQTQRVADIDSRYMQEISQLQTKLRLIESMTGFIQSIEGKNNPIPPNLGFDDPSVTGTVSRYNHLIFQRKRLLKTSSPKNPVVVNIDEQLGSLRAELSGSLNSLKKSITIQISSLQTQDKYFSNKLYSAPIRQKDLRIIEREQTIKEQLYLYLLQKREEAEITSHVTLSNARVIDQASTINSYPVSPNKKMIYAGAGFLGLLVPFLFIYLSDLLSVKVSSKEDIENTVSMPILGSIPRSKIKDKIVVSKTSRSEVSEAFRIIRTNLSFLLAGIDQSKGSVIFVTSTISGEGKTMVSANLSKALALSGKKIVYVGTDFRKPKFHHFVKLKNGEDTSGFTNFIMDPNLQFEDVIYKQDGDDPIYILPSGLVPPNPSELLMQDRVSQMFAYLRDRFDYIVVDTAPVSLVTDTLLIGDFADLCIYVVRENYSDRRILQVPENLHTSKRFSNMAILLNAAGKKTGYSYGYGYGYGKEK